MFFVIACMNVDVEQMTVTDVIPQEVKFCTDLAHVAG